MADDKCPKCEADRWPASHAYKCGYYDGDEGKDCLRRQLAQARRDALEEAAMIANGCGSYEAARRIRRLADQGGKGETDA